MASLGATRSAMDLQQLDGLQSVLGMVKEQLEDGAGGGNPAAWGDEAAEEGYKALSATDLEVQRRIFDQFDVDNTGQLAQVETMRMLKAMALFDTADELLQVIKKMDDDNSGTIDYDEYVEYIDERCERDPEFFAQYRARSHGTKLGYDGTSWRKHANIAWMTNQGILILTALAILGALIHFRFIMVPMTMAYFLTFLLGPIQDTLIQRPLVCCGFVACDKPFCRPALREQKGNLLGKNCNWWVDPNDESKGQNYHTPSERWKGVKKDNNEWDGVHNKMRWEDEGTGCCYAVPPPAWSDEPTAGGGPIKNVIWNLFVVAKVPEAASVLVTFLLTGAVLFFTFAAISAEIVDVAEDPKFQDAYAVAIVDFNALLKTDYKLEITELVEANNSIDDEIARHDLDDVSAIAGPYVLIINEVVTTLLLCLYMLSTRLPETEEEVNKEVQRMHLGEKIKAKVKFYVVLKTALSALTGGLVGACLFLCDVRLSVLFALITFMLNFIPNVGSLIAMVMPIPLIILDDLGPDEWSSPGLRKLIAIGGPAFVQLYVGNVLEPAVFGKSLNVTAISVLVALVLWGSIWGLQGVVLSMPLLAATKIALEEADHPMAKMILRIIRESAAVDDSVEQGKSRKDRKLQRKATQARMKEAMSGPTASGAGAEVKNPIGERAGSPDDSGDVEAPESTE